MAKKILVFLITIVVGLILGFLSNPATIGGHIALIAFVFSTMLAVAGVLVLLLIKMNNKMAFFPLLLLFVVSYSLGNFYPDLFVRLIFSKF